MLNSGNDPNILYLFEYNAFISSCQDGVRTGAWGESGYGFPNALEIESL
jgi:hypothetical protein